MSIRRFMVRVSSTALPFHCTQVNFTFVFVNYFPKRFVTSLHLTSWPFSDGNCHLSFAVRNADISSGIQEHLASLSVPSRYLP